MAATSEEEKKRLLTLQPNVGQMLPQSPIGALMEFMAAQRANAPVTPGTTAPPTTTTTVANAPAGGQSDLSAFLHFMSQQQKGFDPVAAQAAIRDTPVADYQAQQQIAASQAAGAGLAATAAEDAAVNRATAQNTFLEQFPGQKPPALGETFSKMLPGSQGTLTTFPSGGYTVSRSPKEQLALQEARRRNYAERGSLKPTGPRLTYGSGGYSSY